MSYREKTTSVSMFGSSLILGYYLLNLVRMIQDDGLNSSGLFNLWGRIIVLMIIVNIVGNIITLIVFKIIETAKGDEEEPYVEDERDKLIELKGTRVAYIFFSIGVFISMLTLVFNLSPLVMFSLLILSWLLAEILAEIARFVLYRRGF